MHNSNTFSFHNIESSIRLEKSSNVDENTNKAYKNAFLQAMTEFANSEHFKVATYSLGPDFTQKVNGVLVKLMVVENT